MASLGILLARTDPEAPKHSGISYFICPMDAPGATVRPIVDMTGDHAFNEVFFEDVRLSSDLLVGDVNGGWSLAKVTLGNERVSLSGEGALWGQGPTANDLVDLVRRAGGTSDKLLRHRLMRIWSEGEILRLIRLRTVSAAVAGREPGPEASVRKALADDHGQHVMEVAKDLAGAHGMTGFGPFEALSERRTATALPPQVDDASGPVGLDWPSSIWSQGYLFARALTIGGGTAEVQRNIIAERVLGLPSS
jgi:alkylation response protein AidB-like acyl-CoA dehydrogenase